MPFVNRFLLNANGAITFTGNTLGLSRSQTVGVPGTVDSIGGFITTDTTQQYGSYPPGTTSEFLSNSSAAQLVLPKGSSILYAELIWGGTYIDNGVDLSMFIDNPVSFTTPSGTFTVPIDAATSFNVILSTEAGFPTTYAYVRSADVTSIVTQAGAGTYQTGGVTGTIVIPDSNSNHAGWTLAVVYSNPALPLRNLSLRVGAVVILSTAGPVTTVINGFATPPSGSLDARVLISAQEGDAVNTGDQALLGPNADSLKALFGPNNFASNFFASQINNDSGNLDTTGTFGDRNQINGTPGTDIIGGRQGWDITNVDGTSTLVNNQTTAVFQLLTSSDGYLVDGNALQIQINQPLVSVVKSANVSSVVLGDTITYTVVITNTGLVDATNGMFLDTILAGSQFIPQTVVLDGVQTLLADPNIGIPLGNIAPQETITIQYQVSVIAINTPPVIKDQAEVMYTFVPTQGAQPISTFVPSNITSISEFYPDVAVVKSASPLSVVTGQAITYTFVVSNSGNIATNTTLVDLLPTGSTFVPGSVTINGVAQPSADPTNGIAIGNVLPGGVATVAFNAFASAVPTGGILTDQATANYTYQPPDGRTIPGSTVSNIVNVAVSALNVSVVKAASLSDVIVGDTITYTLSVTNSSAIAVSNVVATDPTPAGSVFVTGSVIVGGVSQPLANPNSGIPIGTLGAGSSVTVVYSTTVTAVPQSGTLDDQATLAFQAEGVTGQSFSNMVSIPVFQASLILNKTSDISVAVVGSTINYAISAINTGNIPLQIVVTDIIAPHTAFVPGSVRVGGTTVPGANPELGIPVGTLLPFNAIQVAFQVVVISVPPTLIITNQASAAYTYTLPDNRTFNGNQLSNIVVIQDPTSPIQIVKTVQSPNVFPGGINSYTITVSNIGEIPIMDAVIVDSITPGTVLVSNSVTINGVVIPGADISTGLVLGTIAPLTTVIVTFQEQVVNPDGFLTVNDTANITYTILGQPQSLQSNTVQVNLVVANVTATKSSNIELAAVGNIVCYKVLITNNGNVHAAVEFFDPIPAGTVFIPNSVFVRGYPFPGTNPANGVFIGTVESGTSALVTFLVTVVSVPASQQLVNQATIDYTVTLSTGQSFSFSTQTNTLAIPVVPTPTLAKRASMSTVTAGDTLTFYLTFTNPSAQVPIASANLIDVLPHELIFVPNSVVVNGVSVPQANIQTGVQLGVVGPLQTVSVSFLAEAMMDPVQITVVNQAQATFIYELPDGSSLTGAVTSNAVNVIIEHGEE